jgi:hypothetical protein
MSAAFLLTSLIVVASPGTGVLFTLAAGLSHGRRMSVVAAFGCTLGIVPHMLAAVLGLAAVLHSSAVAFDTVKFAGVGYLLYLAWQTVRDEHALTVDPSRRRPDLLACCWSRHSRQSPQPQAVDLLRRVPPAVRELDGRRAARAHARAVGHLHAHDVRRVRRLWRRGRCRP